jgi:hypothetical protein
MARAILQLLTSFPSSSQIRIFAVQFVVLERYIDIFIALSVAPRRALVDNLVLCARRSCRSKDRLHLCLGHFFVDLIVIGAIDFRDRVPRVATSKEQHRHHPKE